MPTQPASNASGAKFTEADLVAAFAAHGGPKGKLLVQQPKMLKATFDLLKSMQSGDYIAGTSAIASGTNVSTKFFGSGKAVQQGARSTSFVLSTFKVTMDLTKVTKLTSVGAIGAYIGAATVQKTGLAVSLAGGDSEKAKCIGAIMELAGSATISTLTAPTGVLLALTLASLTASAISAHQSCQGFYPK